MSWISPFPAPSTTSGAATSDAATSGANLRPYLVPGIIGAFVALVGLVSAASSPFRFGGPGLDTGWWTPIGALRYALFVGFAISLAVPVVLAVRRPILATGLAAAALVLPTVVTGYWPVAAYLCVLGVIYVSARSSWLAGLLPLGVAFACLTVLFGAGVGNVIGHYVNNFEPHDGRAGGYVFGFTLGGVVAYGLGLLAGAVGSARTQQEVLTTKIVEVDAAAAVTAERARLARDLHDVVAHHVSLIAVRAETAPYTLTEPTPETRAVLDEIAQSARLALDELRTILGVLRRSDAESAERAPQPTLADVRQLVATAEEAGQRVVLTWAADPAGVNDAVGLVAYRLVQEGLTNARSHAAGATVQVDVRTVGDALLVRVHNDAPDPALPPSPPQTERSGGFGLVGLRERVESVGGQLSVGAVADGGFVVDARFPLGAL
ncbi:MAG: histidine kinase [Sporichthyaceae bacterium]|nr:histidine kinase [Sporichthyaceae bacterium]